MNSQAGIAERQSWLHSMVPVPSPRVGAVAHLQELPLDQRIAASSEGLARGEVEAALVGAQQHTSVIVHRRAGLPAQVRPFAVLQVGGLDCVVAAAAEALARGQVEGALLITEQLTTVVAHGRAGLPAQVRPLALLERQGEDAVTALCLILAVGGVELAGVVAGQRAAAHAQSGAGLSVKILALAILVVGCDGAVTTLEHADRQVQFALAVADDRAVLLVEAQFTAGRLRGYLIPVALLPWIEESVSAGLHRRGLGVTGKQDEK